MKQKNYNIELIRLICFLMVIVIHVTNYFCRSYGAISFGEYVFAFSLNSISRISIPCFFMISGYLLLGRDESSSKILKRVARFSGVLLFWTFVYFVFNNYYTHQTWSWKQFFKTPVEAHLWYLYAIIPLYLMLIPFRKIFSKLSTKTIKIMAIIIGLIYVYAYTCQIDLHIQYLCFFILGYIISRIINELHLKQELCLVIFWVCNIINIVYGIIKTLHLNRYASMVTQYRNPIIVLGAISFFVYVIQYQNGNVQLSDRLQKLVESCCACSFGVYLIHIIFLDIYKQNFTSTRFSVYVAVPMLTVIISVLSIVSIYMTRKTTFGRHVA